MGRDSFWRLPACGPLSKPNTEFHPDEKSPSKKLAPQDVGHADPAHGLSAQADTGEEPVTIRRRVGSFVRFLCRRDAPRWAGDELAAMLKSPPQGDIHV